MCWPCRRSRPCSVEDCADVALSGYKLCKAHQRGVSGNHRKRARFYGVPYEPIDPVAIFVADDWRCGICHGRISQLLRWPHPRSAVLDHVLPLSMPGSPGHVKSNVQAAHNRCNGIKGDRVGLAA
jgi:5-methylcytosine-specific restriction endonuclease McrA